MISSPSPCHSDTADCSPTLYHGILKPKTKLGPILNPRQRDRRGDEEECGGSDVGRLVFGREFWEGKEEVVVENVFLLVEFEDGECRLGGQGRRYGRMGGRRDGGGWRYGYKGKGKCCGKE
jgi:hypothetical protein